MMLQSTLGGHFGCFYFPFLFLFQLHFYLPAVALSSSLGHIVLLRRASSLFLLSAFAQTWFLDEARRDEKERIVQRDVRERTKFMVNNCILVSAPTSRTLRRQSERVSARHIQHNHN
jgi:hypothetical protein